MITRIIGRAHKTCELNEKTDRAIRAIESRGAACDLRRNKQWDF